ncbi:hypothetical protein [Persephonella sp.]
MDEQLKLINRTFNNNICQSENLVFYIGNFVINSLVIHPFPNGNGKTFWILNDILLIKAGFLPIFVNRNKKNIETLFIPFAERKKIAPVLKRYFDFIIKTYKNYKF